MQAIQELNAYLKKAAEEETRNKEKKNAAAAEWGSRVWKTMDILVEQFDTSFKEDVKPIHDFFIDLGDLIPCPKCKAHYRELLERKDPRTAIQQGKSDTLRAYIRWIQDEVAKNIQKERMAEDQERRRRRKKRQQQRQKRGTQRKKTRKTDGSTTSSSLQFQRRRYLGHI
jgi:hypothetical protein